MILKLQMLNEDATLNNFQDIGSAQFIPGQPLKLVMRLLQTQRDLRYVPADTATMEMSFLNSDGTTVDKVPTFLDDGDRSLVVVELDASETTLLIGQNLELTLTEGAVVSMAALQMALQNAHLQTC